MNRATNSTNEYNKDSQENTRSRSSIKSSKRFRILSVVGGCTLALLAFGALPRIIQDQSLISHTRSLLAQAPPVSIVVAKASPAMDEFTLPGTTQAIQDAVIYARVNGYLRKRYADIGDKVKEGQILAEIDTPELDRQVEAASSNVDQAVANLENVKATLKKSIADQHSAQANIRKAKTDLQYFTVEVGRYKSLSEQGAVSEEDRDTRIQAYNAGLANLESMTEAEKAAAASVNAGYAAVRVAQSALDSARAQYQQIAATQSFKQVRSLFDGIITQRNVDAGALITSGSSTTNTALFEVARGDFLRIYVYVPEQYVAEVHEGEEALLNFQEYPGQDFVGTVRHVAGGIDPTSKTLQVEIHIQNADHKLLPGMYAQVRFRSHSSENLAIVPSTTAQTTSAGCFMYTVDDRNVVHMHKVEIGTDLGGQLKIARGILPGDRVIVSPSDEMRDGLVVAPAIADQQPTK